MRDKREPLSVARVQDCAARGLCKADAARELGVGPAWLGQFAAREGICFQNKYRNTEILKKHEGIINAVSKGMSVKDVAKAAGLGRQTVRNHLHRAGIPLPELPPRPRKSRYEGALLDAQRRGLSGAEFRRETGMDSAQLSDLCRNLGIVLRDGRLSRNKGRKP